MEVGNNLYHICEFAERIVQTGATVIPLRSSLPEKCYVYLESTDEIGVVTRGESGYVPAEIKPEGDVSKRTGAEMLNDAMGVTKSQAAAMSAGSMFGWDAPAADPANYDEKGTPLRNSDWNRGER